MDKQQVRSHLQALLEERITAIRADIASTLAARNSDTKSSAGDKHEVGRAMVQQELDQLEAQLAKLQASLQELARVPLDHLFDRVAFGSLVTTNAGLYFIAIGLGRITFRGAPYSVISLASPIGQALQHKRVGDVVVFNGTPMTVQAIE
ncbi:MAG TPA: 3-oxoacyl-ACP synthase [Flavobacteriales bacterium]|nr:3-oxoacyl-ACP synthase [Flavobacteriales bacterium]